mmetsp:Transcript_42915/g.84316  ORF Transcript_42915/g.84316 Transcript_42915/m.84316 type:complete len:336 (-) Transcript_42915:478-1485(-)
MSYLHMGKFLGKGGFCQVREIDGTNIDFRDCEESRCVSDNEVDSSTEIEFNLEGFFEVCDFHTYQTIDKSKYPYRHPYAIKRLKNNLEGNNRCLGLQDLHTEAEYLKELSHPNIIQIRGVATGENEEEEFSIILDRIDITLEEQIRRWEAREDNIKKPWWKKNRNTNIMKTLWAEKVDAAFGIASAMQYVHTKDMIYRDLKPQNIGLDKKGEIKLLDFGLARKLPNELVGDNYLMTALTGSMRYMSPEVFNEKPYNLSADVYSFGILFWQICSLKVPFDFFSIDMMVNNVANGITRPKINGGWRKDWIEMMKKCWDNDSSLRPSFLEIKDILGKG